MHFRPSVERTLQDELPELLNYLEPGMAVLDIGCGFGTITLAVAAAIDPGTSTGVDIRNESIAAAKESAKTKNATNAVFHVMDAHELEFDDASFNLIYSYTVAHFWMDPVKVMCEVKRVAKPGAWIITAGIRDYGSIPYYPPRPMLNEVWNSLIRYMEFRKGAYQSGNGEVTGYWDFNDGRKCVEWYNKAKIQDLRIHSWIEEWWYPGSPDIEMFTQGMTLEFYRKLIDAAVSDGFVLPDAADAAFREGREWIQNPHAYSNYPLVTIVGRA